MRAFLLVAGAALTLSACGGGSESQANNEMAVENLAVENLIVNDPAAMDANMDANLATNLSDPATANAVANDLTTNTPDANLANGM